MFDGQNISFDASLVIYINSTNIPPIMIINRIYETQNRLSLLLVSFLVGLRTYQHPCTALVCCGVPDHRSRHFPANAGSLCDRADVTSDTTKDTLHEHTNWSVVAAWDCSRLTISGKTDNAGRPPVYNLQSTVCYNYVAKCR